MSNGLICIVLLGTLCVYQGYRIRQLRLDMLDQLIQLWRCQKRNFTTYQRVI
nr:MAG TPA: hypothetical protein [Caudoviricetes sp.]